MVKPRRADIGHWIHVEVSKFMLCMEELIVQFKGGRNEPLRLRRLREPKWLRPRRARAAGQSWIS